MTFAEYVKQEVNPDLYEWQYTFLNKMYEIAKERGTPFIFPARRGNGISMFECITTTLLHHYMEMIKEEH